MTLGPDLELDPITHDLVITDGALSMVADVAQAIKIRLLLIKGEWFLDTDAGVPYFESIWIKGPNIEQIKAIFRKTIVDTPGVSELREFDVTYDNAQRSLTVTFTADSDEGEIDQVVAVPL
jgi:hypothetical protein